MPRKRSPAREVPVREVPGTGIRASSPLRDYGYSRYDFMDYRDYFAKYSYPLPRSTSYSALNYWPSYLDNPDYRSRYGRSLYR